MASSIDQQFIEYIVKSLVGKPDEVKVERRIDEKGVLLELTVDPEDLGRVIGKRGATAQSLRTLLRALGTKNDARYNLKIVDTGPPPERSRPEDDKLKSEEKEEEVNKTTLLPDEVTDESPELEAEPAEQEPESESDRFSKTRAELADLDDLEV